MNPIFPELSGGSHSGQPLGTLERGAYRFAHRGENLAAPEKSAVPAPTANVPVPQPPTVRPRGRFLIAGLMVVACSAGILTVWDSLLRYKAYGVVTGRIIDISTPINGVLRDVHVCEGDKVRQSDRLATVADLESEQKLARIADELRIADATLHAEIARLRWQTHVEETEMTRSIAEFFETSGTLHSETGTLDVLRDQLDRAKTLDSQNAATASDVKSVTIKEKAQQDKIDELHEALLVMKTRAENASRIPRPGTEQIRPLVAKAEMLLNEIARLREWIAQGDLRAPVNGTILKRHHPAGEGVPSREPLFTIIEESSTEIELYLPQSMTGHYRVGETLKLKIEPFDELVPCEITAIGPEHRTPPEHIEIFYRSDVKLLPVRLKPPAELIQSNRLSIGAVAKLPHLGARG